MTTHKDTLTHVPEPLVEEIFDYLNLRELIGLQLCCRWWKQFSFFTLEHKATQLKLSTIPPKLAGHINRYFKKYVGRMTALRAVHLYGANYCELLSVVGFDQIVRLKVESKTSREDQLPHLLRHLTSLQHLDVESCQLFDDECVNVLVDSGIAHQLVDFRHYKPSNALTNAGFAHFVRHASNLRELSLANCFKVDDSTLHSLVLGCPKLESVDVSFCIKVSDRGVAELANLSSLNALFVKGCGKVKSPALQVFADHAAGQRMTQIDIGACAEISKETLRAFVARHCKTLRVFRAAAVRFLDDEVVAQILADCPELEELRLDANRQLSVGRWFPLGVYTPPLHNLRSVSLRYVVNITDKDVSNLARRCPNLRRVELDGDYSLTDLSLEAITKWSGATLEYISVRSCILMGGETFLASILNCPRLMCLGIGSIGHMNVVVKQIQELHPRGNLMALTW